MIEEFLQAYTAVKRMARKDHRCCECLGWIKKGEEYHYHSGVCDGRGVSYKHCAECERLFAEVDAGVRDPYERTSFEGLRDAIFGLGNPQLISRFTENKKARDYPNHCSESSTNPDKPKD